MSVSRSVKASVKSTCAASQAVGDSAHHSSAVVQSWVSDEKNSYVIQTKKKLKSHKHYKDSGGNQLTSDAKKLISVDELYCEFSHLVQDEQGGVIMEATKFQGNMRYHNDQEREAAKEREQKRFDRLTKLKLTVCLRDIGEGAASLRKDRTIISIANFFSMEYSGKHASILVEDVLLEWDSGNVIFPRRVSDEDKFMFEGDIRETGEYFNRIADQRPQLHDEPKPFEDEGDILCNSLALKIELIKKIVAVVVEYNSAYYYNTASRNCQDFVRAVLKAAKIEGKKFSSENEDYLQLLREGKMRVPQSFKNHEEIDSFVMRSRDKNGRGLSSLNDQELSWLQRAYKTHHGVAACVHETCQLDAVIATLVSRQNP